MFSSVLAPEIKIGYKANTKLVLFIRKHCMEPKKVQNLSFIIVQKDCMVYTKLFLIQSKKPQYFFRGR